MVKFRVVDLDMVDEGQWYLEGEPLLYTCEVPADMTTGSFLYITPDYENGLAVLMEESDG